MHMHVKSDAAQTGYRLIMNTGSHGYQEVEHMHLHLIGGQAMKHPMGWKYHFYSYDYQPDDFNN